MENLDAAAVAHIAVMPTSGMGHLIPVLEFVKRLYHYHRIASTLLIPTSTTDPLSPAQSSLLASLPPSIQTLLLPAAHLDDDVKIETRMSLGIIRSLPSIRDAVKSLHQRRHLSAFVVDLFGTDAFEVAVELKIPYYVFFPSTAMALSLMFHLPELDETTSSEYWEASEKFQIPGCIPIHGRDLVDPLLDRKNYAYKWFLHHSKRYKLAQGIVLNSFTAMERGPIETFQKGENGGNPRLFPVGPLIRTVSESDPSPCLTWMNQQPIGSILYVSFGSGGTLSHEQMIELALGLEISGQRFLWAIKCPHSTIPSASFFKIQNSEDPLVYLPEGFLDRTRDRGRVVPEWAPQVEILAHESVGGFLTHCGWNSTLESVVNGVPMIAWPLYAEQRMNAVMLGEGLKVAMRLKFGEEEVVGRDEIGNAVRNVMEGKDGKEMRNRVWELKKSAAEAIRENGESVKALAEFAERLKKKKK